MQFLNQKADRTTRNKSIDYLMNFMYACLQFNLDLISSGILFIDQLSNDRLFETINRLVFSVNQHNADLFLFLKVGKREFVQMSIIKKNLSTISFSLENFQSQYFV